ncbi:MAG: oxygenase MpaB family protein [Caldilineaceae bacterium]
MQKQFTQRISQLDPNKDYHEITKLLSLHVFPWDIERALEFALFRTYAVPSISGLLAQTGEFVRRTRKRYDDTELILYEVLEHGFESERGRRALRRMNQMHGRFPIANEDLLYVLTTFIFEPIRWVERFGWRPMTANEKQAFFRYYCELGRHMGIQAIPSDYAEFEQFNVAYEREHFKLATSNRIIGDATVNLLLGMYAPKLFWPLLRPAAYALMDEPLLAAFGFPLPPHWLRQTLSALLRLRARVLAQLPERTLPWLGTQRKRPTYPEGYEIEELGTFKAS